MHSFQKKILDNEFFYSAFLRHFARMPFLYHFFLRFPHTLFVKGNSTTISHLVGYSVVKEHFGPDSLDLFIRSYSPAELFALYIGLLKNRRKINPHSKTFSW